MKKLSFLLIAFGLATSLFAQQPVKKYVLLEHFTNSNCSVCGSRNPAFYSLINQPQYASEVHHIAVHPSVPYPNCALYLGNPVENNARAAYYNIQGTPQVALNGIEISSGNPLLPAAKLDAAIGKLSPVYLRVNESSTGNTQTVDIGIRTQGAVPAGNYKLYAAVVEKTVNYKGSNTETVHHDVFRKMLPDINGAVYTPAALGQTADFQYSFAIDPAWKASEIYVVAFVQNTVTKEILNSGTKFDPVVLAAGEAHPQTLRITPNPTRDLAYVQLGEDRAEQVEMFNSSGQRVAIPFSNEPHAISFPTAQLAPGLYFLKITGKTGFYTGKMVKD